VSGFFVTGGTLKPDASSYIQRPADDELFHGLLAGEYCTVLTTRQMGKSSLMARTALRLRQEGIHCATVDLQGKGENEPPPEQWYYGVIKQMAGGLGLSGDWAEWWKQQQLLLPAQRMTDFFADIVLRQISGRVVVFVDEVDWMIRLPFSDEFFAAIRSCFNRRATEAEFDRLSFVLLGSAAPAQLIKDSTRTPFNIGRGIELTDFTPREATTLAQPLGAAGEALLSRIFYWTDGHPYLTQMLCAKVIEKNQQIGTAELLVDDVVEEKLFSTSARLEENNLKFVGSRLTQGTRDIRKVLVVYRDVLRGKPVQDLPASPIYTSLRLSGVVKPNAERRLQVRNRIYHRVFDERWVSEKMPVDVRLPIAAIVLVLIGILGLLVYNIEKGGRSSMLVCGNNCAHYQDSDSLPAQPLQGTIRLAIGGDSRDDRSGVVPWAFQEARKRGAKAFIFLGDLELTPNEDELFLRKLNDLGGLPLYPAMGNHEVESFGFLRRDESKSRARVKTFKQRFIKVPVHFAPFEDEAAYSADLEDNVHFIALDNVSRRGGGFGTEQLNWLESDLKSASAARKVILVGMHKGLANNPVTSHAMDEDGAAAVKDSAAALALFQRYKVAAVFVSHSHMYAAYDQGGIEVRLTGGLGAPLVKGLFENEGGFHHFLLVDVPPGENKTRLPVEVVKFPGPPVRDDQDESKEVE
jgi:hypothetical protein